MLRKFAAALVASTLIAAPALAAQPSGGTSTAQMQQPANPAKVNPAPSKQHARAVRHTHLARGKTTHKTTHQARHGKPGKAHQATATISAKRS